MKNTIIISGHPDLSISNTNSLILKVLEENISPLVVRRLDEKPFELDIKKEQEALVKADIIVFQFPFYWYSVPAVLKYWIDVVLEHGFAYGSDGDKLKGKDFILSTTVGGPEESYKEDGFNNFGVDDYLKPFKQLANLSGMTYHTPIRHHSMIYIPDVYNTLESVQENATTQANELIKKIKELS